MHETKKVVQVNESEADEIMHHLVELLKDRKVLCLESIISEDSCTTYNFRAKSDECDNICIDIINSKRIDCGELETFAV